MVLAIEYLAKAHSAHITHAKLAATTGLSRGSIYNVLSDLRKWKMLNVEGGRQGPGNASLLEIEHDFRRWQLPYGVRAIEPAELPFPSEAKLPYGARAIDARLNGSKPPATWVHRGYLVPPGYVDAGLATLTVRTATRLREIGVDGFRPEWATVAAWYAMTQPKLEARGYRSFPRAALAWWQRAKPDEINGAEAWVNHRTVQQSRGQAALFGEDDFMRELGGDDV